MGERRRLLGKRFGHFWMGVAQTYNREPSQDVEVLLAVLIL